MTRKYPRTLRQTTWAIVSCGLLWSATPLVIRAQTPASASILDNWRTDFNRQLDGEMVALASVHAAPATSPTATKPSQYESTQCQMDISSNLPCRKTQRLSAVVREILTSEGMPPGLAEVVHVESGFNLTAVSPRGAAGLWQFMPATAREYGLVVTATQDDRFDVFKSTVAAAHYLRELHYQFNNWPLALAAYNAGPNRVSKAMQRLGTHDFWTLSRSSSLPGETVDYVSKVLAVSTLALTSQPLKPEHNISWNTSSNAADVFSNSHTGGHVVFATTTTGTAFGQSIK